MNLRSTLSRIPRLFFPKGEVRSTNLAAIQQAFMTGVENYMGEATPRAPYSTHSTTYACMTIIGQAMSSVPFKLWKETPDEVGRPIEIYNHPLLELFADPYPGLYADFCQFVETIALYLESTGNAWIFPDLPNSKGMPRSLLVLGCQHVSPVYEKDTGRFRHWVVQLTRESAAFPVTGEDLIHFKYTNPESMNQVMGIGPLEAAIRAIASDTARQKYDEKFFVNGSSPSLKLTYTPPETRPNDIFLTDEQVRQVRATVEDQWSGVRNAHKVAIVHGGMKLEELGLSQKEMDFIEGRKWSRQEVASVFRIPVPLLNDFQFAGLGREGVAVAQRLLYENNIVPKLDRLSSVFQKTLVEKYAPGLVGGFDIDEIPAMREDLQNKATVAKMFFDMGFPINQINQVLDLGFEPVLWGDDWLVANNLVPARSLAGDEAVMPMAADLQTLMDLADSPAEEDPATEDQGNDNEDPATDAVATTGGKSLLVVKKRAASRTRLSLQFEQLVTPLQDDFFRRLHRFFFEIRQEMLRNIGQTVRGKRGLLDGLIDGIMFDVPKAQRIIEEFSRKHYRRAIEIGIKSAASQVRAKPRGLDSHKMIELLDSRVFQIRNVPVKLEEKVRSLIKTSLKDTAMEGLTIQQQAVALREATQEVMTLTAARSRTIARTEMLSVVNEARALEYEQQNIEALGWLSSQDDLVREGHDIDGEIVAIGDLFSNGLRWPGDILGRAENVVHCRCTTIPEVLPESDL